MSMRHFWLLKHGDPVPARWAEAFPDGEAIDVQKFLAHAHANRGALHVLWMGAANGAWIEHVRQVLCVLPTERVVVLSSTPTDKEALRAVAAGARGYAHSHAVPALLQELALVVAHGGYWLGPGPMRLLADRITHAAAAPTRAGEQDTSWDCLSSREAEVALAVREGRSNKEIARLLGISERTVKAHLGAAFEKLGVRDRLQLVLRLSGPAVTAAGPPGRAAPELPRPGWTHDPPARRPAAIAPVPPSNRNVTRPGLP
jgi:DNA-binding NarL/FixJ family response regulator